MGTALTEVLALGAEESDFHKLIGKVLTDNLASLRFVQRCGFHSVGLHLCHGELDGTGRDVMVVERLLGSNADSAARSRPAHESRWN